MDNIRIDEIKSKVKEKYKMSYIAEKMDISIRQAYRILDENNRYMSIEQYNKLIEILQS